MANYKEEIAMLGDDIASGLADIFEQSQKLMQKDLSLSDLYNILFEIRADASHIMEKISRFQEVDVSIMGVGSSAETVA